MDRPADEAVVEELGSELLETSEAEQDGAEIVSPEPAVLDDKAEAALLDALRRGMNEPGEQRLFRAGKLAGLFPSRSSWALAAARYAVRNGMLAVQRTEYRGKSVTEWVSVTAKGIDHVLENDSPKVVLDEIREAVIHAQADIPTWLQATRQELAGFSEKFEQQADAIIDRLDTLSARLQAALRRADLPSTPLRSGLVELIPWADAALGYLDKRAHGPLTGPCPLGELFAAVRESQPTLNLADFHAGLLRLRDNRAVQLHPARPGQPELADPEYALLDGATVCYAVTR